MRVTRRRSGVAAGAGVLMMTGAISGCGRSPAFNVLGSYFPGWIVCLVLGILVTALLRWLIQRRGWEERIPMLPLFYFGLAVALASLLWLIAFE